MLATVADTATATASSTASRPSLRLEGLTRLFGKVRAVDGLSLEVPGGAFVTLLGPSGCGKSTTLSLIAGLEKPDAGKVFLGDKDITKEPPNERRMAMVFQNYALYPHMSVSDNIAFSLKLLHRPKHEIRARVNAVADRLDIVSLLKRRPNQLSGGQQQRVALGRALVKEPLVFLLDEPFSNLDAGLRSRMRTEVKYLHLRLNTTSIFVTHDQEEAMVLSDLIAVMRDGKVVQYASQQEVYAKPTNLYVATFVGKPKMSLIQGRLENEDDAVYFVGPSMKLRLGAPREINLNGSEASEVVAGVRAEDVGILDGDVIGPTTFRAVVSLHEPIGSDTFVELAIDGVTVVSRVAPDRRPPIGQTVTASVSAAKVHLFDAVSGARIN
ncbi:MAG TPA: ABC transporter ATP-binding protein, partial [Candidatus Dormibacteraeota bacterium]|nr:ABC transporter ATP-binding protein [Candidatus Dormibacteraeota bacterium]